MVGVFALENKSTLRTPRERLLAGILLLARAAHMVFPLHGRLEDGSRMWVCVC